MMFRSWHFKKCDGTWSLTYDSEKAFLFMGFIQGEYMCLVWCVESLSHMCVFSLRALLLGLASNHNLKGVSLDLNNCEVRTPGYCTGRDNGLHIVLSFSWKKCYTVIPEGINEAEKHKFISDLYFAGIIYRQTQIPIQKAFKCVFNDFFFLILVPVLGASCLFYYEFLAYKAIITWSVIYSIPCRDKYVQPNLDLESLKENNCHVTNFTF